MSEPSDYKMTTAEYVSKAIAILVNPVLQQGSVRLVCADTQPHEALNRLERAFFDTHAMLGLTNEPEGWAKNSINKLLEKTFPQDMLCISMPNKTPVVLIKETAVEKMTVEQALEKAHASSVLAAIKEGLVVPRNVLKNLVEQEKNAILQRQ